MFLINLNVTSPYKNASIIDIKSYIKWAATHQITSLTWVNHHTMYGVITFIKECSKLKINPMIGMQIAGKCLTSKTPIILTVYIDSIDGYYNLVKLTNYLIDHDFHIETNHTLLKDMTIIVHAGEADQWPTILKCYTTLNNTNQTYLGAWPTQQHQFLQWIAQDHPLLKNKVVPFHKVTYLENTDLKTYQAWLIMNKLKDSDYYHYLTQEELINHYDEQLIINLNKMSSEFRVWNFWTQISNQNLQDLWQNETISLKETCEQALNKLLTLQPTLDNKTYVTRLAEEINIITQLNYEYYFLIVADYINYAKTQQMLVGPGRGSVVGSLTAYLLNITSVDPIKFGLMFERFLNIHRTNLPDIDIDIQDDRRHELINYINNKYGESIMYHIGTYQHHSWKTLLMFIEIYYDLNHKAIDKITSQIKMFEKFDSIKLKIHQQMGWWFDKYPQWWSLFNKINALPKQASVHPSGIIFTNQPLPLHLVNDKKITQYTMDQIESLKIFKFDILSLRTLTIIQHIVTLVEQNHLIKIDLNNLNWNDSKVFKIFNDCDILGIFQLESSIFILKQIKIDDFYDLVAILSLLRPGTKEHVKQFINAKNFPNQINYFHDDLASILKETVGVVLYQEQVMKIMQVMAAFTLTEADLLRQAISKKYASLSKTLEEKFFRRSLEKYPEGLVIKIWKLIVNFMKFGFNKSHAVAYTMISYQMAFLKSYYYQEFMIVMLNESHQQINKIIKMIEHDKKLTIKKPSINDSTLHFITKNDEIIMPFTFIKNINHDLINFILAQRQLNGVFESLEHFLRLMQQSCLDKYQLKKLIAAGCFDEWHDRTTMLMNTDKIWLFFQQSLSGYWGDRLSLWTHEPNLLLMSHEERDVLGFNLLHHPTLAFKNVINARFPNKPPTAMINVNDAPNGLVYILCVVKSIKLFNQNRLEIEIEDYSYQRKIIVTQSQAIERLQATSIIYVTFLKNNQSMNWQYFDILKTDRHLENINKKVYNY